MNDFSWDDVRVFVEVGRAGTLTGAAEVLGINTSTAHRRIAALERALGVELFQRDPRGYSLTPVGEAMMSQAEEIETGVATLRRTATGHDRTARGPVTLTMPETMLSIVVPQLASICEECPGLRPILRLDDRVLDLGAEADIAIRPSSSPPAAAVGRKLGRVAWAVYARNDADTKVWLTYTADAGPRGAREWVARHFPAEPVLAEVSSVSAMYRCVLATAARGMLPCYLADADENLSRRSEIVEEVSVDLWLLLHANLRRSARVRAMVEMLTPRLEQARPLFAGERP